ncbi:unnamed protein product, partial [Mesorhabditis spiculigera]
MTKATAHSEVEGGTGRTRRATKATAGGKGSYTAHKIPKGSKAQNKCEPSGSTNPRIHRHISIMNCDEATMTDLLSAIVGLYKKHNTPYLRTALQASFGIAMGLAETERKT